MYPLTTAILTRSAVSQELLLHHRARSVVVCPPSLAGKWQDEMREKIDSFRGLTRAGVTPSPAVPCSNAVMTVA
ncbi:MAG: hypothetical protein ACRDSR_08845 [Pseudonocardiaceae bacterium]